MNNRVEPILASILMYFPISWASALGGYLGRRKAKQGIKLQRKWVARMHYNLENLKGVKEKSVREQMIVRHIEHIGRIYAEYPLVHRLTDAGRFTIVGENNLRQSDKPTLFISAHTGHWELLAEVLNKHQVPVADIYDPIEDNFRLKVAMQARRKMCPEAKGYEYIAASKHAAKKVVSWIKKGGNLLIFCDEEINSQILTPSFGRETPYSGNLAKAVKLATKYNMQIVPMHVKRTGNAQYIAIIEKPIEPLARTPVQQKDLGLSLNKIMEKWVLEDICHWYWLARLELRLKS